ncbi:hypothetical protein DFH05DRAFT_1519725 [Lentinula detonsa]|uniref:Uncharacterized protein n=1 Tax=Lentinula detonsa TaxID=2804962 RepID=A0A9W8U4H1_9AGAR|nr:hypothetical protein DFH05DRAFT_1519725 [Lentinula detonsa]
MNALDLDIHPCSFLTRAAGLERPIGFESLPIELDHLIADEIGADAITLSALTLVSRKLYDAFNQELFRSVNRAEALVTLASSQNERYPLQNSHPATFVKHLNIWVPHKSYDPPSNRKEVKLLRIVERYLPLALRNISVYGQKAALRSLMIDLFIGTTSFAKLVGNIDEEKQAFAALREVSLRCCFLVSDFRQSLARLRMALGPSLQSIELLRPLEGEADPRLFSKILGQIGERCGNLTRLCIELPDQPQQTFRNLQTVFTSSTFCFPSLRVFSFTDVRFSRPEDISQVVDITSFLRRHPGIEELEYQCLYEISLVGILPKLTRFCGFSSEVVDVCGSYEGMRPLETIVVSLNRGDELQRTELVAALRKVPTVRRLIVQDTWDHHFYVHGLNSLNIRSIVEACPNLTHLQCTFDVNATEKLQQNLCVIGSLSTLQHLKLDTVKSFDKCIQDAYGFMTFQAEDMLSFVESSGQELMLAIGHAFGRHQAFQTALVVIFGWFGPLLGTIHSPPIELRFAISNEHDGFYIEDQNDNKEWDFGTFTRRAPGCDCVRYLATERETFEIFEPR